MRKIITSLLVITLTIITLSGCSQEIPLLDSEQSNIGGTYYNHVMETDIGFYYNSFNDFSGGGKMSLHYFDKETGKNIYLCSKPECQHDGSIFCSATNGNIIVYNTVLYGDYLYMTGTENQENFSIYRAKFDGTELTKLVDFIQLPADSVDYISKIETFLIHRGKAYLTYSVKQHHEQYVGINGIIAVDLSTLKYETIEEIDLAEKYNIKNMKASGDCLYYMLAQNDTNISFIKHYNTVDNTLETVPLPIKDGYLTNLYIYSYVIIGDEIWISCKTREDMDAITQRYMAYDMVSGEMREPIIPIKEYSWTDSKGNIFSYEKNGYANSELMYDGKYLYVSENCTINQNRHSSWVSSKEVNESKIHIYDLDGTHLTEFPVESFELISLGSYNINVLNDKVYMQTRNELKSCPVQDILDGNFAWTTEFEFTGLL